MLRCSLLVMTVLAFFCVFDVWAQPLDKHGLHYDTPATVWDEAMPLGNGLLGALVWGDGAPLRISLDRTDLWDLRPVPEFHDEKFADVYKYSVMRKWVKEGRINDLHKLYDDPYHYPGPTKIPAGRIELTIGDGAAFKQAVLNLADATATVELERGVKVRVFVHAAGRVGFIEVAGTDDVEVNLIVPPFGGEVTEAADADRIVGGRELSSLKYKPPIRQKSENMQGFEQQGWGDFRFAVVVKWQKTDGGWLGVWSIATSEDAYEPLRGARLRCEDAFRKGFEESFSAHRKWWDRFWSKSSVRVPNEIIERQWYLETYKFGSATRPDTPPITLQGPWTADNMKIPPWKGDYHHDLNTQLSYWPCYSGNHLEGGAGYLNWLWDTKDNAKAWTKRFFNLPGLNVPMTADLKQNQIGGWHQYTHSATTAGWLAHHFYLHWRYSMDRDFLEQKAYPWLREVSVFFEAVTEKGADGRRTLPLSSSPEINDNRLDAWFSEITNYDVALIRWTLGKTAELADELDKYDDAKHWRAVLAEMPGLAVDEQSLKLLVAHEYPLKDSHRHFSHLMAIHPLGLITWEDGPDAQKIIKASLKDLDELGTGAWCGYSFSWLANLAARARDGEKAAKALEIFSTAFCLRSSFHCNGDQSGKGYSGFTYRPFTLEGNFAAAAGVQEMLLQSYSGTIRVFPAIPESWKDVSFKTLRAEGAFLVSAERKDGNVEQVEIVSEKGGVCRLENPFGRVGFNVSGIPASLVKTEAEELILTTKPGDKVILTARG